MTSNQINNLKRAEKLARLIVQSYRDNAPHKCDPQAIEGWIAGAAVAVSAAASVYGAYSSAQAKSDAAGVAVPQYHPYTPTLATQDQYAGIRGLQGAYQQFGGAANQIAQGENNFYRQSINAIAPGTTQGIYLAGKNANQELRGEIPADVQAAIQRASAQSALAGGYGADSGQGRNLTARDLGRTSLDLTQMGAQGLSNNTKLAQSLTPYRAGDILGTAQQYQQNRDQFQMFNAQEQTDASRNNAQGFNQQAQQQYQQQVNQALAPNPYAAAGLAAAGSLSSGLSAYAASQAQGGQYYGADGQGFNTSGFYGSAGAAGNAFGAGAQLGFQPGKGGGYYNTGYSGTG